MDPGDDHDVDDVAQGQGQAGDDGGKEDLADGDLSVGAHGHQHDGGRDQNTQRTAGAHHAAGQRGLVAAAQQDGQGQHAHGDHGSADDTGGGGEHGGDQDDCQTQAALDGSEQVADGFKQAVCHLRVGQEVCHQDEHGDSDHGVALHLIVDFRHSDRNAGVAHGDSTDQNAGAAQHEGQLLTQHQTHDHQAEQQADQNDFNIAVSGQGDHQISQYLNHSWASFPSAGIAFLPLTVSTAAITSFKISETDCTHSKTMPRKKQNFTGQVGAAHTEYVCSWVT